MPATKEIIAENIAELRKASKLTQAELAEKLNYSDKAVSKWERGDSVPDVLVLAEIAELFSVTIDYFLHKHDTHEKKPVVEADKNRIHLAVSLTACVSPYALAVLVFFILNDVFSNPPWLWKTFITPLPAVAILAIIFCALWVRNKLFVFVSVSALLWSIILTVYVFVYTVELSWLLFVIGAPLQLIILLWLFVVQKKHREQ